MKQYEMIAHQMFVTEPIEDFMEFLGAVDHMARGVHGEVRSRQIVALAFVIWSRLRTIEARLKEIETRLNTMDKRVRTFGLTQADARRLRVEMK